MFSSLNDDVYLNTDNYHYVYSPVHRSILYTLDVACIISDWSKLNFIERTSGRTDVRLSKSWSLSILYKCMSFTNLLFFNCYNVFMTMYSIINNWKLLLNEDIRKNGCGLFFLFATYWSTITIIYVCKVSIT